MSTTALAIENLCARGLGVVCLPQVETDTFRETVKKIRYAFRAFSLFLDAFQQTSRRDVRY